MFEISSDGAKVISLAGRFDAAQAEQAIKAFEAVTDSCVVDMQRLDYISSAGLGILLATYKRLHDVGKTMVLKHMNEYVRRVFQVSGLDRIFVIE